MSSHLPILIFLVPFFMGVSMPLLTAKRPSLCPNITLGAVMIMFVLAMGNLYIVQTEGPIEYALGGWTAPIGIAWLNDSIAAIVILTVSVVALLSLIYGRLVVTSDLAKSVPYYSLILLMISGLVGIVFAADLFNVFVFLEVAALTSYALVGAGGGVARNRGPDPVLVGAGGGVTPKRGTDPVLVGAGRGVTQKRGTDRRDGVQTQAVRAVRRLVIVRLLRQASRRAHRLRLELRHTKGHV